MGFAPIHRVVTGHDAGDKAIVARAGPLPTMGEIGVLPGTVFRVVWPTCGAPAAVDTGPDPTVGVPMLGPQMQGTEIRFVDIPSDSDDFLAHGASRIRRAFAQIGDAARSTAGADSPRPLKHRNESVDYGVVIDGEMTLVLDDSGLRLKPRSVVVQRGTPHAWANRSGRPCPMLLVLVDRGYEPGRAAAVAARG